MLHPLLVDHFIRRFNSTFNKDIKGVDPGVMDLFNAYHWPGNVCELERVIEHAFVFVKEAYIREENIPQRDVFIRPLKENSFAPRKNRPSRKDVIRALQKTRGRKKKAAEFLGISRTSLWRRMKSLELID